MPSISLRPWPVAPRPFDDEAFGSWFGRVASRYQLSVIQAWAINHLGPFPPLTNAGWILFPPLPASTLNVLATLARLDVDSLMQIQTRPDWLKARSKLPYCFVCLTVNPADVFAPRWKSRWLDPETVVCEEHGTVLDRIPIGLPKQARNMTSLLSLVSKYRRVIARSRLAWRY
ncbi:TniQ family protein [Caballeronia insecticola]|uniref:TniQ family protein n=1 Tax=Caballeronia insecticola TaxID=758793 RepID=UPI000A06F87B|nr:TniQ family protein [Caballeronia insecticola]